MAPVFPVRRGISGPFMHMLSFVILTWNSRSTIENCLSSISALCGAQGVSYDAYVVDNGSSDGTSEIVERMSASMPVELIRLPHNRGTTVTRNLALKKSQSEFVCIMDSDAALLDGDLPALLETLRGDPGIGIIAPRLLFSDGAVQHSVRRFPTLFGKLGRIPAIVLKRKISADDIYPGFPFDRAADVDYAISACWFFRRDLLDAIGYLDERIFYSPEDVDFCIRAWKAGRRIVYYPAFTVLHHIQRITHRNVFSRIAVSHLLGLLYYFVKHRYIHTPGPLRENTPSGNH